MINSSGHIISRCRWDTSFDKKEMGTALQGRLSSWSRLKMPAEMEAIFDKVCPPEQVWKIQSLEIDLGPVSFNDLEPELTLRFRKQLSKKLADLVLHRDESGDGIEIIDEDTSHIGLISHFLLFGLLPRNYKNADGSINQVLTLQLQNNRQQVIAMLREIGVRYENVRKRVAWQISEANIVKIVEGLEPNNAQQVIDFSAEITAIQTKESIVQTGIADFKKNLWFWILNYLFAERGSVFNKVAFMKSNISQMAQHYHVSYDELIGIIRRAVDKVAKHKKIKADIMLTLRILAEESMAPVTRNEKVIESAGDIYKILEGHFSGQVTQGYGYSKTELNDMVLSISGLNEASFRKLLLSFSDRESLLQDKLAELNENTLEVIFSALSANDSVINSRDIYFLVGLCVEVKLKIEKRYLWQVAIQFIVGKKGVSFSRKEFLDHLVTELGKKNHAGKAAILEQLMCADIPSETRALSSIEIYTDLTAVFAAEISQHNSITTAARLGELLDMLSQQIRDNGAGGVPFIALQKPLVQYIRLNPAAAFKALVQYKDKRSLQKLLPHLLSAQLISLLTRNAKTETAEILLSLQEDLIRYKFNKASAQIAALIERALADTGLVGMLCDPGLKAEEHLELVLEKMALSIPASRLMEFFELLDKWHSDSKILGKVVKVNAISRIKQMLLATQKLSVPEQAAWLMLKKNNQGNITKLLSANFRDKQFVKLRALENKESAAILNYLLKGGENLMDVLVREYVSLLNKGVRLPENKLVQLLKELYWKCILDNTYHSGGAGTLRKLFETAVWSSFQIPAKNNISYSIQGKPTGANKNSIQLQTSQKITLSELFFLVKQAITLGQDVVIDNGSEFRLTELIVTALEVNAAELVRVIKNIAVTENRIKALTAAVSFDQFCLLIANVSGGNMHDAIGSVQMLYELVNRVTSGHVAEKLLYAYWRTVWNIIRTNKTTAAELKALVAESLYQLAIEKQVNSDFIISEINKLPVRLTPLLKTALAGYNSAFGLLPVQGAKLSRELHAIKQKGLLYNLSYYIITHRHVPLWFFNADEQKTGNILNEIVAHHPVNLLFVLKHEAVLEEQMAWLHHTINFKTLINSIAGLNQARQLLLNNLEQLYKVLERGPIAGVSVKEMRYLLFRKLMVAWTTNSWAIISGENIWNELVWDIVAKKGGSKKQFIHDIEKVIYFLPPSLQIGFRHLKEQDKNDVVARAPAPKRANPVLQTIQLPGKEGIVVRNAGLVLVNNYIPVLLERLGIVGNKTFLSLDDRTRAVHYLQYVVTGLRTTEEHLLPLNKVMCGLPLAHPVEDGIGISEEHHNIIEGLIIAMIGHWPSIGDNSVYGFRGNWLVRDGVLTELGDKWELTVEKRAYDILLNKSPFSFSIIKYPWMDKPIHVSWKY
jgi:hypothetical protein